MREDKEHNRDDRLDRALSLLAQGGEEALHPPVDDLTRRRVVDAVLSKHARKSVRGRTRMLPVALVAAAAGIAAAAALLVALRPHDKPSPIRQTVAAAPSDDGIAFVPRSKVALLHGEVQCAAADVVIGGSVPLNAWIETGEGHSAFSLPTGIAVGLSKDTSVRVNWDGRRSYSVEMAAGMALFSVDPKKMRDGFSVQTPEGTVRVKGTLFTVDVTDEGTVAVYLHRGSVVLETPRATPITLPQGRMALLDGRTPQIAEMPDSPDVQGQMRRLGCMDDGRIFSEFDTSICDVDTAVEPRTTERQTPAATGSKKRTGTPDPLWTVRELLAAARDARLEGRHAEAAVALRELIRTWPDSPDARTALVTLGQLELKKLGQPADARRHFTRYLEKPGHLSQDALLGQADACRALSDGDGERAALQRIIRDFPGSPAELAARRRLQDARE